MNFKVIGICGRMRSGKDYIGSILQQNLKDECCIILSFADQLKFDCLLNEYTNKSRESNLSKQCNQNISDISNLFQKYFEHKPCEIRKKIQDYGMDKRQNVCEDYWINNLFLTMLLHSFRGVSMFLITDVRFENEYNFVKNIGGKILKVVAPNRSQELTANLKESQINHESESFIDSMEYDYLINNDDNPNLFTEISNIKI